MSTTPSPSSPVPPTPQPRLTICPYCGARSRSLAACESCGGRFDPLSRQATQNAMGPWFLRIESQPFRPGCNYATLLHLIDRGTVRADTAVRGPTTKQFWMLARWCPGVAHRLGICHNCQAKTDPESSECPSCGVEFASLEDRQTLGLGDVRPLPGRSTRADPRPAGLHAESAAAPIDPAGAARQTGEEADAPPDDEGGATDDLGDDGMRELRLRRDLRRSRRWTAVWSGLALVILSALGGYVVFLQLDLGAGPVGRWLAARESETASDQAGAPSGVEGGGASLREAGGEGELAAPDAAGDTVPASVDASEGAGGAVQPVQAETGEEPGPEQEVGPRIRALSRLRGLR